MTGYGKGLVNADDRSYKVEIKSLNSKNLDLRIKSSIQLGSYEMEIRKMIAESMQRGKVEVILESVGHSAGSDSSIDTELFKQYYQTIKTLKREMGDDPGDLLNAVFMMPNVVVSSEQDIKANEWSEISKAARAALENIRKFRKDEGSVIHSDLEMRVRLILSLLIEVETFEQDRLDKVRKRIQKNLDEWSGNEKVDENRFEQEVIYYLEKMDVTEEKVRLDQHCQYFIEHLEVDDEIIGRKLTFISQEMGREINTLGAKANSSDIQKLVVQMKDELEKIKEQLANVL